MQTEICVITKANLNNLKGLDITKEKVKAKVNELGLNDEGLRKILSQSSRLKDFTETVEEAVKELIREKAVKGGIGTEPIIIETDNGNITVTPKESVILLDGVAERILAGKSTEEKNILGECYKTTLDIEKIRKLKKANVITEEEWLTMTVKGEPTYAVSIK